MYVTTMVPTVQRARLATVFINFGSEMGGRDVSFGLGVVGGEGRPVSKRSPVAAITRSSPGKYLLLLFSGQGGVDGRGE